jgi:phosphatidylglycerol:prolipoprotein diacylglycerol transferase
MADIFGPNGINIGSFTIYYYGILIVIGILLAATVASWLAKRDNKDPDHIWGGLTWALIPGIIGARVWFVLFPPQTVVDAGHGTAWMLSHPFDLEYGPLAIRYGGLGVWGGIIGGLVGIYIYSRRHKLPLLEWLDLAVVAVPLAQAIGRWGNYINKELYGPPTDLPWGIEIPCRNRVEPYTCPEGYGAESRFHPLFLYESLWNLFSFGVLLFVWNRYRDRMRTGDVMLMYFILYPAGRFFLEFMRVEIATVGGVNINQAIMGITALVVAAILLYRHRPGAIPAAAVDVQETETAEDEHVTV